MGGVVAIVDCAEQHQEQQRGKDQTVAGWEYVDTTTVDLRVTGR